MKAKRTTAAANLPLTLDEAKAHCRVTTADEDALINELIKAATSELETRCQRTLCETGWSAKFDGFPEIVLLRHPPVLAVSSITYIDAAGATQTLAASDYVVDLTAEPARITAAPGKVWPVTQPGRIASVTVNYTAGYLAGGTAQQQRDAVPRDLRSWLLIRVATLYENRESVTFASAPFNITALDGLWQPYRVIEA